MSFKKMVGELAKMGTNNPHICLSDGVDPSKDLFIPLFSVIEAMGVGKDGGLTILYPILENLFKEALACREAARDEASH